MFSLVKFQKSCFVTKYPKCASFLRKFRKDWNFRIEGSKHISAPKEKMHREYLQIDFIDKQINQTVNKLTESDKFFIALMSQRAQGTHKILNCI